MKALLVDPDPRRAPVLAQALAAAGVDVSIATSASFALTMLEWNQQDVIISRARLGDMEGHELCAIVRSDPSTKEVRFVLVVGPGENVPRQTAAAGVDLLLPDALSNTTVVTRVVQLVRRQQEETTPTASVTPPPPPVITPPPPKPAAPPRVIAPPPATPAPAPPRPPIAPPSRPLQPTTPPPQWSIPPIVRPTLAPAPPAAPRPAEPARIATPPPVVPKPSAVAASPSPSDAAPAPAMAGLDTVGTHTGARTFQGALGVLEIEELTQAIAVGGKTGRLVLVLSTGGGLIVFESGRVTHAEYGGQAGEPAFGALVAASHREGGGKFCFIPVHPNELRNQPKTIVRGVEQLLLDVARTMDEEKRA
jgi:CheY-like chemotaxis protein